MTMTDPIADMLTRIRNANVAMHDDVTMPSSKLKESLAAVLQKEGYIQAFRVDRDEGKPWQDPDHRHEVLAEARERVITGIRRVSKPGLRVYTKADAVPRVLGGLGVAVVSTSKGLLTDREARRAAHRRRDPLLRLVGAEMSRVGQAPIPVPVRGRGQDRGPHGHREGPQGRAVARPCPSVISVTQDGAS